MMREVERMREVESEDGSLAALGRSKLTHLAKLKRRDLRRNARFSFYFAARDVSPIGNLVKKFLMADLVVCRAPGKQATARLLRSLTTELSLPVVVPLLLPMRSSLRCRQHLNPLLSLKEH
jgi:hypothetical protein